MISTLQSLHVIVAALSHDNAAVNGALVRIIQQHQPHILDQPCAAHVLNLIMVGIFNGDSVAEFVKSVVGKVSSAILNSGTLFEHFLAVQQGKKRCLFKFAETRWLGDYISFKRFQQLKASIIFVLQGHQHLALLTDAFWHRLDLMITFLQPFAHAQDILQADYASVVDVLNQLHALHKHCLLVKQGPHASITWHAADIALTLLALHFKKHVEYKTAYWCARFASKQLEDSPFGSPEQDQEAEDFFKPWASQMLVVANAAEGRTVSQAVMLQRLSDQLRDYRGKKGAFARFQIDFNEERQSVEMAARERGDRAMKFDARSTWQAYLDRPGCQELSFIANCLLSINCSEACVERSFSLQKLLHSQVTNRLKLDSVQSQLEQAINSLALQNGQTRTMYNTEFLEQLGEQSSAQAQAPAAVNQEEADAEPAQEADEEQPAAVEGESEEPADQLQMDEIAEVDEALNELEPALAPVPSFVFEPVFTDRMRLFAADYIEENQLQKERTWRKRGSAEALRNALLLCEDADMQKEMPDNVQRCIEYLMHNV